MDELSTPEKPARRLKGWLALMLALSLCLWMVRTTAFWDALSPVTHKTELYRLAGEYKVDPLLLAAIIRTESHFNPFAESPAGAVGLMQLLPSTAKETAAELKLDYLNAEDLYVEETNLKLGTYYFAKLLKAFGGNLVLALAAYNAGLAKVRSWNLTAYGSDQDEVIAAIPAAQTRNYVSRVLSTYRWYKRIQKIKRFLEGTA